MKTITATISYNMDRTPYYATVAVENTNGRRTVSCVEYPKGPGSMDEIKVYLRKMCYEIAQQQAAIYRAKVEWVEGK